MLSDTKNMDIVCTDEEFYSKIKSYWSKLPPTLDGVLGGYGFTSNIDILESEKFLIKIFKLKTPPNKSRALDCGAGIGRVTFNLLLKYFDTVDIVEQNPLFLNEIKCDPRCNRIGTTYCTGLQHFMDIHNCKLYDIIWCQWIFGNLTDNDLVKFFKSCRNILSDNGILVLKENIAAGNQNEENENDHEITRTFNNYSLLFAEAGLRPVFIAKQRQFPKELYKVQMFALKFI